jgi:hybrid cluster-associated redox disulfide protein
LKGKSKMINLNVDLSISDLLNACPQVVPVFIKHHMACVGCSLSAFETIGSAAKIYGLAPDVFLRELESAIQNEKEPRL